MITVGTFAAFVWPGGLGPGAFGALTEVYGDLLRAAGAAERLSELLHAEATIAPPAKPRSFPQPPLGTLEFARVEFHYPTRLAAPALHDFSLPINPPAPGEIVHPSGAGRSSPFQPTKPFSHPQHCTH